MTPDDWPAWHAYRQKGWRNEAATPPGRRVIDETLRVAGEPDALVESRIDLRAGLPGGLGQLVVVVRPAVPSKERPHDAVRAWVQATRIGLDAFADGETFLAWASDLTSGRTTGGVELSLGPVVGRTREDGLARLALGDAPAPLLVARRGPDVAILPQQASWWNEGVGWRRTPRAETLRFCVFDDRKLYRPGEAVRVKGWLRRIGAGPRGDVEPLPASVRGVAWTLRDSQGNESGKGRADLGPTGAFDLALKLPPTFNLGSASLQLEAEGTDLPGRGHVHGFLVQEFRRPEFEVKASASEGPYVTGGSATVSVSAAYYAGGALPGAEVTWQVAAQAAFYRPPNRDDFVFGTFLPWWLPVPEGRGTERSETFEARTDGTGVHRLRVDFEKKDPPRPRLVTAEATVMDVNRQAWTAEAPLLVHPSLRYVGLRPERAFVQKGEDIAFDVIATDLDGASVAGSPVRLRVERLEWEQVEGEWKEVPQDIEERTLASGGEPVSTRFQPKQGGSWRVLARVADAEGRENETELRVWVAGGRVPPRRDLEQDVVTLVPDRKEYRSGDVARLLVVAPFAPAEAVLTLRRSGLVSEERFTIASGSQTLEIPIEEAFTPNVHVQVDLVGQAPRDGGSAGGASPLALRPAFASGSLDLPVPPASRTLALAVTPREPALEPGGETVLDPLAARRLGPAGRLWRGDGRGRGRGGPRAHRLPAPRSARRLLRAALCRRLGLPAAGARAARGARRSHGADRRPARGQSRAGRLRDAVRVAGFDGGARSRGPQGDGRRGEGPGADSRAHRFRGARALRRHGAARLGRPRTRAAEAARQPHALPRDGGRRLGGSPLRLGRGCARGSPAADGATLATALPELRRPLRAAGGGPEPDGSRDVGRRGSARPKRRAHRRRRPAHAGGRERPRRGALPDGRGARRDDADPGGRRVGPGRGRGGDRAAGVDTRHHRGLRDLRPGRRGRRRPAGARSRRCSSRARRARAHDLVDGAPGADRRRAVPRGLPLRVRGAARRRACSRWRRYATCSRPSRRRGCRSRTSSRPRWRATWSGYGRSRTTTAALPSGAVATAPGPTSRSTWRTRSGAPRPRASRSPTTRSSARGATCARSTATSRRSTGRTCAARSRPTRSPRARCWAIRTRRGRGRSCARRHPRASPSRRSASCCRCSRKTPRRRPSSRRVRRRIANGVTETAAAAHFAVSYGDGAHLLLYSDRRADAILLEALIADQPQSDLIPKLVEGLLAQRKAGRWTSTQENVFVLLALDRYFQSLREDDARLRRARLARRALRGIARLPRPHDRAPSPRDPDGRAPRGEGRERPAARQGGRRAALLPDRPALRAAGA